MTLQTSVQPYCTLPIYSQLLFHNTINTVRLRCNKLCATVRYETMGGGRFEAGVTTLNRGRGKAPKYLCPPLPETKIPDIQHYGFVHYRELGKKFFTYCLSDKLVS